MWLKYTVSVFRRFSTRYFGICHFFLQCCGIGYPPMSPSSSAKYDAKHMFSYLHFWCYFEANGQNHINFRPIQILKNSMAWHFLTFRSFQITFQEAGICISPVIFWSQKSNSPQFLVKFNAWTSQRLLKSNPQVNHRTHLVRPLTVL